MTIRAIISRAEAKAQGLKRYFTGIPCTRGHVRERSVVNWGCLECLNVKAKIRNAQTYDANREHIKARITKWRLANRDAKRSILQARRSRQSGAEGRYTQVDIHILLTQQHNECLCGVSFSLVKHTIDHKTPLSRGGTNWPDNLQLLCGLCNSSKGTKLMCEWIVPLRRAA